MDGESRGDRNVDGFVRLSGLDLRVVRLGIRMPMQVLWRVDGPVDRDALAMIHRNLLAGSLTRRVEFARIPFARPVWLPSAEGNPIRIAPRALGADEVMTWVDDASMADLDVIRGRGWELAAAQVTDGTSIVSLVCSHALTDGHGLLSILTRAARDEPAAPETLGRPSIAADVADAVHGGLREHARLAALRAKTCDPAVIVRNALGSACRNRHAAHGPARSSVAVQVDTASLERIAAAHAGTATGLALAVTANVARCARDKAAGDGLTVAVPVSLRTPDDAESSNVMAIAAIDLEAQDTRYTDLEAIRRRCKSAYERVSPGDTALIHTDAGFSTVGVFPADARHIFGPALGVIGRAISDTGLRRGHIFVFSAWGDGTTSLWFQATGIQLDRGIVADELRAWGIDVCRWW